MTRNSPTVPAAGCRGLLLCGVLLASTLTLGACGSDSTSPPVASLSPTGSSSASPGGAATGKASALAYSRCMRSHGVKDFPDPNSSGDLQLNAGPGTGLDPSSPAYKQADQACKPLLPATKAPPGVKAANVKYAKCMRGHGLADFPDPKPDGTLQMQAQPGSDLDPANPRFKAANDACKRYLPDQGGGGSLHSENK